MRRLTIASVAYPFAAVGPGAVGGAEQVVATMDRGLVAAGHRSIVVAIAGSQVEGELWAIPAPPRDGPFETAVQAAQHQHMHTALAALLAREPVDLVHLHGLDFHAYLPPPPVPALATLHLPPTWYPDCAYHPSRARTWLQCVSAHQAREAPGSPCMLPPIGNGVAVDALGALRLTRRGYALMLARVCEEKGIHSGIEAARRAGWSLLIGGEVYPYPAHERYFAERVAPLLDRRRRFLGPVDFGRKRRLLAGAACVLIPSTVSETSSLVAMEAASCGTPVIAFAHGALPEIVEDGRTGFIVADVDGMVAALGRLGSVDSDMCRQVARERFSREQMVAAQIERYRSLIGT